MKKGKKILPAVVLLLVLAAGIALLWLRTGSGSDRKDSPAARDVTVQGVRYPGNTEALELKNPSEQDISALAYLPELKEIHISGITDGAVADRIRQLCPDARLTYTVVVNGTEYDMDTNQMTLSTLTEETVRLLDLLPGLETVDAADCTDYDQLVALWKRRPEVDVRYTVSVAGEEYGPMTQFLELKKPRLSELQTRLAFLPCLWEVDMEEPEGTAEELQLLLETYPEVDFSWTKTVLDSVTLTSGMKEVDLSGVSMTVAEAESAMTWVPAAEKVIMTGCGIADGDMAAFREEKRDQYKVVWTVDIAGVPTRTDETIFHACGELVYMSNEQSKNLVYCEDMVIVDIGHSFVEEIEWVRSMPDLKYLILADNRVRDLSPISTCKNLIYLELHINYYLRDLTPPLECTALEDLNVSQCPDADLMPLAEMPWLKNLWLCNNELTAQQEQLIRPSLPDTVVRTGSASNTANGWRELQNYFDMREMMGQPANSW